MSFPPPRRFVRRSVLGIPHQPRDTRVLSPSAIGQSNFPATQVRARFNRQVGESLQQEQDVRGRRSDPQWWGLEDLWWIAFEGHESSYIVIRTQGPCRIFMEESGPPEIDLMGIPDTNEY